MNDSTPLVLVLIGIVAVVLITLLAKTVRVVPQGQVYVVERIGRFRTVLQPGLHILIPVVDSIRGRLDVREQVVAFAPQAVITQDNIVVGVDSVLYYLITDARSATYTIQDYTAGIEQLVVTTMRNVIGSLTLEQTLTSRDHINAQLAMVLDEATGKWGVKVNRVEIRQIEPPPSIKDAMEQAMRADRSKRAAILTAEGEKSAAVLTAEGQKESAVLRAQADQQAAILAAEGERQAAMLRAEGEASAIATVVNAIKAADVDAAVLAWQQVQLLPTIAAGDANKVWIVPSTLTKALEDIGAKVR